MNREPLNISKAEAKRRAAIIADRLAWAREGNLTLLARQVEAVQKDFLGRLGYDPLAK